ncbi:MFS transporter [Paractinoplanes lichenicola]|uniref:MFS transporter n=1 Tax=Paractinoplanes lichenicola TaxID=2802976 RepID=A0ABS1W0T8_9ACTN|nr:MFS transporter [Actinoplanes lichenicola]MBL7260307.1 MFS transporter [Actinoplanes lichenicola]
MALPSSVLYSIGSIGPELTSAFDVSRSALGALPTTVFGTAALLSLWSGGVIVRFGARAALLALFAFAVTVFALMGVVAGHLGLAAAMALCGVCQAMSNPATNLAITENVEPAMRAAVVGRKQAAVQLSALVVGLAAPLLTHLAGWRAVFLAGAPFAAFALVVTMRSVPARPRADQRVSWRPSRPNPYLGLLMLFLAAQGSGVSAVATFVPLYGREQLGLGAGVATLSIAVLGVAGVASRLLWSRRCASLELLSPLLGMLAVGAAASGLLVWSSAWLGPVALWAGAAGVGATAVGANAVVMVLVVRDRRTGPLGPASALLSLGFFAGFVLAPMPFGAIVDGVGYGPAWLAVATAFMLAAGLTLLLVRRERPGDPLPRTDTDAERRCAPTGARSTPPGIGRWRGTSRGAGAPPGVSASCRRTPLRRECSGPAAMPRPG